MTGVAWAAEAAAPGGMAFIGQFLPLILIFFVFYFLLIRPQQKKAKEHQAYLANLKRGDRVITGGGIYGQITGLTDNVVTLEIADNRSSRRPGKDACTKQTRWGLRYQTGLLIFIVHENEQRIQQSVLRYP